MTMGTEKMGYVNSSVIFFSFGNKLGLSNRLSAKPSDFGMKDDRCRRKMGVS
jgi:hypothetical protein